MAHDLTEIEARHGFRFGDPDRTADSAGARMKGTLVCTNTACENYRMHVAFHEDTILPIHCGGCFNVLVPDPTNPRDHSLVVNDAEKVALQELIESEVRRILAAERGEKPKKKHR